MSDALGFTAATVDGDTFEGIDLQGQDAVFWFWAPWCGECRGEAPDIAEAQERYAGSVSFVGVAGLGPVNDVRTFIADYDLEAFPHVADSDGSVWKRFGVVRQPAFAFVDADGTVDVTIGVLSADDLDDRLAELTDN